MIEAEPVPPPISDTWVMEIAIEPRTRDSQIKMFRGIDFLLAEDASLSSHTDPESGQTNHQFSRGDHPPGLYRFRRVVLLFRLVGPVAVPNMQDAVDREGI